MLAVELAQDLAGGLLPGLKFLGKPCPAAGAAQRVGDLGRVGEQRAQVRPHQFVQLPRWNVAGMAALPARRAQRVGAPMAQVVAIAGRALAGAARQPAGAAADQGAQ